MIDPTPNEIAAIDHGGRLGGEYLDSIAHTDLATLTSGEWDTFLQAIITGYCDRLRADAQRDHERLDAMAQGVPF